MKVHLANMLGETPFCGSWEGLLVLVTDDLDTVNCNDCHTLLTLDEEVSAA